MVGKEAPDFELSDQFGKIFKLSKNLHHGIVLVFYPKDKSVICTKQLCEYNSDYEEFMKLGFQVVGISVDEKESHKKFSDKHHFNFPILSDIDKSVSKKYKALSITGTSKRKIIVIDKNGIIQFVDEKLPIFYLKSALLLNVLKERG